MAEQNQPTLTVAVQTDVGVVRDHNEDSFYVDPQRRFFVVADGMGGHAAGEVASAMACDAVKAALSASHVELDAYLEDPNEVTRQSVIALLERSVRAAHEQVYTRGKEERDKEGMGTTLDVLLVLGSEAFVAHVGDSRTYLLRDGKLQQLTTDHTMAEVLMIEGKLTEAEAAVSPMRTILVNAIGVQPDVGVEWAHVTIEEGDRLLMCSDGLHDYFPVGEDLAKHLGDGEPQAALDVMVEQAKVRGGHDNITGVLLQVESLPDGVPKPARQDQTAKVRQMQSRPTEDIAAEAVEEFVQSDTLVGGPHAKRKATSPSDAEKEFTEESDDRTLPGVAALDDDNDDDGDPGAPKTEVLDDGPVTEILEEDDHADFADGEADTVQIDSAELDKS